MVPDTREFRTREGEYPFGRKREDFFTRVAKHATGGIVDIDEVHAGAVYQINRIGCRIHHHSKALQLLFGPAALKISAHRINGRLSLIEIDRFANRLASF